GPTPPVPPPAAGGRDARAGSELDRRQPGDAGAERERGAAGGEHDQRGVAPGDRLGGAGRGGMGVGEREHGEAHREVERADPEEAEALADADAAPGIGPVEPRPHRAESGGEADEPGDDDEETG